MTKELEALLPCPFCGEDNAAIIHKYCSKRDVEFTHVQCQSCAAMTNGYNGTNGQPIRWWNTRAALQPGAVDLECLHQHPKLSQGTYEYQCGFLDALNVVKEHLIGKPPGGFVMVPVEPTEEMINAAINEGAKFGIGYIYKAMLSAAQKGRGEWQPE